MWIFDKLFNRKIEGNSSLDHLESVTPQEVENLKAISGKVGVVGNKVTVDGDISASGKIFVGAPNYSTNFVPRQDLPAGLEWGENSYLKFEVYGNILFIVLEAEIKNTTADAITSGALSFLVENLPDSLCEKIIRRDGTNLKQPYSSLTTITSMLARRGTGSSGLLINSYAPNTLGGYFDGVSIPANSSQWLSARLFLTL